MNETLGDTRSSYRRVLLVSHYFSPHVGGIENVVQPQATTSLCLVPTVTVPTTAARSDPGRRRLLEGYNVVNLKTWNEIKRHGGIHFSVPTPWFLAKAANLVRGADVVYIHVILHMTSWMTVGLAQLLGRATALTQHVHFVAHSHQFAEAAQRVVYATFRRSVVQSTSRIIYVNTKVAELLKRFGASSQPFTFIANGVDTDTFQPAGDHQKRKIRQPLDLPDIDIMALFVTQFVPKKSFHKPLQTVSVRYFLIMIERLPPEDAEDVQAIFFLGTRRPKKVADVYRACDFFVLPSQSGGFALTVQKTMASGLRSIISDDPGYDAYGLDRDFVAMMAGTVYDIRSALERVATDEDLRHRMAEYWLHVAMTRFHWSAHTLKLEFIYFDLCSKQTGVNP